VRIAVTDACIFIDLFSLEILPSFFRIPGIEVHTSLDVMNELFRSQRALLEPYRDQKILTVHNLSSEQRTAIVAIPYPRSLSTSDRTVLYLATVLQAIVLSSDKVIRNFAKNNAIEYHGMFWIMDRLVEENLLFKKQAIDKLNLLMTRDLLYQNNPLMTAEVQMRIKDWSN
jgi:hypothetical protein